MSILKPQKMPFFKDLAGKISKKLGHKPPADQLFDLLQYKKVNSAAMYLVMQQTEDRLLS